ncbi:MAG TPA: YaiI/YqxD family protein [Holophagaceae bacterium]|nr:YaiI/YqxD family protein [Holophagaceae bacterium]
MIRLFIDADACPVKDETYRVAERYALQVFVVANTRLNVPRNPRIELKVVTGRFDAADDWIVESITGEDVAITSDIPLAARCLEKGARVIDPRGREFSPDSIGDALAAREFSAFLRDMGELGGGPAPYSPRDRSTFLGTLDKVIQAILKHQRSQPHPQ